MDGDMYIRCFVWTTICPVQHPDNALLGRTRSKSQSEVLRFRRGVWIFCSITTRNPWKPIGLEFSVFREELAGPRLPEYPPMCQGRGEGGPGWRVDTR